MKRKSFLGLTATILFLALFFTGCPQAVDPDKEVVQKPSTTSQKIDAVKTTGEMGKPETAADGTITLITTDSTGGKYTFKQIGGGVSSIRAASPSGTWDYTNSKNIKQFEGTFNGDIAKEGANDLNLTVEKAADATGTLQEVTEPQNFTFAVSASGTFAATIPAVEIAKENTTTTPPANEVKLIKTATMDVEYNSKDPYHIMSEIMTLDLYSDNTFKMYTQVTYVCKEADVDFSYEMKGIIYTGTYTGDLTSDGTIILNMEKMAKGYPSIDEKILYQAYKEGEKTVTFTLTEKDLVPMHSSIPVMISGTYFSDTEFLAITYTPNTDGSTTIQVNLTGDDAGLFNLQFIPYTGENPVESDAQPGSFNTPLSITGATDETKVQVIPYIGDYSNGTYSESAIELRKRILVKPGHNAVLDAKIRKISVPFIIEGNQSQYEDLQVYTKTSTRAIPTPISNNSIDFYCYEESNDITQYSLYVRTNSKKKISDYVDIYLDTKNPPTEPVTIKIKDILTEGNKINITQYPEEATADKTFTDEEKKHFLFTRGTDGNIVFYVPIGSGTDGEFLSCSSCDGSTSLNQCNGHVQELFEATYFPIDNLDTQAYNNYSNQFTGLVDNMKDIVWYLETKKGLTVEGKDLIGL